MHVTNKLYSGDFDFRHFAGLPLVQYMVATIPRSGSTYFALELWRTGMLGAPMEYANPPYISMLKRRLGGDLDIQSYWREIERRRTSPNGVFGYKMFIKNYLLCEDNIDLSVSLSPDKVVFLTRKDVIAQAVSLSKAIQSKAWFSGVPEAKEPKYSFEEISKYIDQIEQEIATWEKIFNLTSADVFRVFYEDLVSDPRQVIMGVGRHIGVNVGSSRGIDIPLIDIQRNRTSEKWIEKYKNDLITI